MTQPGPRAVSGAPFAGNLPAEAARTAEAPGRTAAPAAQEDSAGLGAWGTECAQEPSISVPDRTPPTFAPMDAPGPSRDSAWVGSRSLLSREEVSLEQGNP